MINSWIIFGVAAGILILIIVVIRIFNNLIHLENQVDQAFSSIDTWLKKRRDLIPNLVGALKHFLEHEANVQLTTAKLRSGQGNDLGSTITDLEKLNAVSAEGGLQEAGKVSTTLGQLRLQMEAYPQIKSDKEVSRLMASLNETEEQISAARRSYNYAVKLHNDKIMMFPSNIVAGSRRMKARAYFEVEDAADRQNVDVSNLFGGGS